MRETELYSVSHRHHRFSSSSSLFHHFSTAETTLFLIYSFILRVFSRSRDRATACWRRSGCHQNPRSEGIIGSLMRLIARDVPINSLSSIARLILLSFFIFRLQLLQVMYDDDDPVIHPFFGGGGKGYC